jgi:L-ascorbate metabolism protein UlaG (beta-lactamase superfamily)
MSRLRPTTIVLLVPALLCGLATLARGEEETQPVFKPAVEEAAELLREPVAEGQAILWHLFHSGFALRTASRFLIFDYWPGPGRVVTEGGLAAGFIDPAQLRGRNVMVFVSHEHHDHWYRDAIDWADDLKQIRFVVSEEVARADERYAGSRVTVVGPDESVEVAGVRVRTLRSTDSGVAFLVTIDGLTLYHSGDHAAWTWQYDADVEREFVTELLKPLEGEEIDIAMHVCDSRFAGSGWGGIIAFAETYRPKLLVPMHLKGKYDALSRIEPVFRSKVIVPFWSMDSRGEAVRFRPPRD